jgi:hypothetical protein
MELLAGTAVNGTSELGFNGTGGSIPMVSVLKPIDKVFMLKLPIRPFKGRFFRGFII